MVQAHIKLEAHGFAIVDATKALELDPGYIKVSLSGLRAFTGMEIRRERKTGRPDRL